jgi:hypothetical protein
MSGRTLLLLYPVCYELLSHQSEQMSDTIIIDLTVEWQVPLHGSMHGTINHIS